MGGTLCQRLGGKVTFCGVCNPDFKVGYVFFEIGKLQPQLAVQRLNAPGVADGYFALIRKPKSALSAYKQGHPQLLLQLFYMMADGGLSKGQLLCRPGEIFMLRDTQQRLHFYA